MRRRKFSERLLTAAELVLLAGMVLLSFYLIYGYLTQGEAAVSKTVETVQDDQEDESDAQTERDLYEKETSVKGLSQAGEDESVTVRVRILDNEFSGDLFEEILVSGTDDFSAESGTYSEENGFLPAGDASVQTVDAGEVFVISAADLREGEAFHLIPEKEGMLTVTSLERADGSPSYAGELYVCRLADGLALVNEVSLKQYLYGVVASEMPSWYPTEALKAQAVCARTCALQWLEKNKNEKTIADLDDSTRFQVYNNYQSSKSSREAVDLTDGEILLIDDVQYYSTSCLSENREDLGDEERFRTFLSEPVEDGAEYGSVWVRWQTELPASWILEKLAGEYGIQADSLDEMTVTSRNDNGQALLLQAEAQGETLEIEGEYAIRQFLTFENAKIERMDNTTVSGMALFPSAFFWIEQKTAGDGEQVFCIYGGGFGHGNGMSQCGAAKMASDGASCADILEYYYGQAK